MSLSAFFLFAAPTNAVSSASAVVADSPKKTKASSGDNENVETWKKIGILEANIGDEVGENKSCVFFFFFCC